MQPDRADATTRPETDEPARSPETELTSWQLARVDAGSVTHPDQLAIPDDTWTAASVPGTVAAALAGAGEWDWAQPLALDDHDWWYRCRFRCDEPASGASLDFGGLATLSDVWLNGQHILSSDNMFVAHTVDTGDALQHNNEMFIRFASVTAELSQRRPRPRWRTRLVTHQNLRWIRTSLLGRMAGWSSAPQPVGPWKRVTLIPHDVARVISKKLRARLDGPDGLVSVAARVRALRALPITSATVTIGDVERPAIVRWSGEDFVIHATIRIADVAVWWPHTHGEQPLYNSSVTVRSENIETTLPLGRVGFRTLRLDTANDDFCLRINDEPVFWRGACWSPPDPLRLHCTGPEYRRILELARDGGMNMLRIGGTMVYEHDAFYDLCDELGIVVWQDFMLANMDYPIDDEAFADNIEREATQILQRLGGHASLGVLCGNSEVEQQAAMLGLPASEWRSKLFSDKLPDLAAEHAASVPYWPSSPSGGVLPFHVNAGDGHYFGYGPYLRPFSDVRASDVKFASETLAFANVPEPVFVDGMACGVAGAGHHPEWKRGVPRDNGSSWDFEDVRDHYVNEIFGVNATSVRYGDPERYLALGRVAGGEVMERTFTEWRRGGSRCGGGLVWLYRDLRPGAGWGVLDYNGAPKAAYYYLSRAFRPVTVIMSDEGLNGIAIHALNESPISIAPELRLSLFRGSVQVNETTTRMVIPPRSTVTVSADEVIGSFSDVTYAYRFGPPNHDVIVASLIDPASGILLSQAFHFPLGIGAPRNSTELGARVERITESCYSLTVTATELALAVAIESNGWRPCDNYFHVAPGATRTVLLTATDGATSLSGRVTALNAKAPQAFHS